MNEPKHTPGPWWVEGYYSVTARNPNVPWGEIGDPEPNYVAVCVTTNFTKSHDVAVGNANLIAAAPEMLKMLEDIRDAWETDDDSYIYKTIGRSGIQELIAKAGGECE